MTERGLYCFICCTDNLFHHAWNSLPFSRAVGTSKSRNVYSCGTAPFLFQECSFSGLLGHISRGCVMQGLLMSHFVFCVWHRLQIPCPQPSFITVKNQKSRWPAINPFPSGGPSLHLQSPEIHLWKEGVILIKEICWVSNKTSKERHSEASQELGHRAVFFLMQLMSSLLGLEKSLMFT